jgi:putative ABC transport system permease protein
MSTTAVAPERRHTNPDPATAADPKRLGSLAWLRERGMGASVLVAAISTAFGVVLITVTEYLGALLRADPYIGDSGTLAIVLSILSVLLVGLAIYVAGIVTANTFATVIVGRTRRIALLRLIGASARSQRNEVARQGFVVGEIGAVLGILTGLALSVVGVAIAEQVLGLPDVGFSVLRFTVLVPAIAVVLTTWLAAWVGSRRVLTVTPLQALAGSVEAPHEAIAARKGRNILAGALLILGAALLALGIAVGLVTPLGVVVAFLGGLLSFTGLSLGATLVMPPVLRLVGRWFGTSVPARLAADNALRYPERSSRMAIGVVMGVTLVTMFAVAMESAQAAFEASADGALPEEMTALMDTFAAIMMGLVAVSAVIAGVGLVNLLTLGVVQRRRELGLLRALGVSNAQVRRMVLFEAAHITVAASLTGLALGIAYGWAGAQSLLGSVPPAPGMPAPMTLVAPAVPLGVVLVIVAATALLTLVASLVPTRLATRLAPVEALAE